MRKQRERSEFPIVGSRQSEADKKGVLAVDLIESVLAQFRLSVRSHKPVPRKTISDFSTAIMLSDQALELRELEAANSNAPKRGQHDTE
jgi:hypothetical protein